MTMTRKRRAVHQKHVYILFYLSLSVEKGSAVSYSAFLFSLSNKQGTDPVLFPLKTDKRYTAHPVRPGQGPTFGNGDLVLETMSNGYSELDNSFGTTADAGFLFAEANNFVISDLEVLYKGGSCDNNKLQLRPSSRY